MSDVDDDRAERSGDAGNAAGPSESGSLLAGWAQVVRGVDAVQHAFAQRLETVGMSLPYFAVLRLLDDAPDQRLPMSRIARDLEMTSGGFTKLADRMARDGLIDRRGSAGDRRVVFAALTGAGRERATAALQVYEQFLGGDVVDALTREGLDTMATLAARLDRFRDAVASIDAIIDAGADVGRGEFTLHRRDPEEPERREATSEAADSDD